MTLLGSQAALHEAHDAALVDLDGVCYRGKAPIPHAAESLTAARAAGMTLRFVTNNASREPETVADQLTSLGIDADPTEVMTAAQAGAALLTQHFAAGDPVLVVGGPGLRTAVTGRGFRVVGSADDAPVAVIQGWDAGIGWSDLAEAAFAIGRGATHVATNLDASLPLERGQAPGNGALVAAVAHATGVEPLASGKPEPEIFHQAAADAGSSRPLVIGDRLDTDIAGAVAAGMPSLLVLTGVSDARDVLTAAPHLRPTFLGRDLRDLLDPHPAPEREPQGWWVVGEERARVTASGVEIAGGMAADLSLEAYRALVSATWAAADEGLAPWVLPGFGVARR